MITTPLPYHLPAQSGALNGHLMTPCEIAHHDAMIWADELNAYRHGPRKAPSLPAPIPPRNLH
jgi:hypothetical protein